MDEPEDDELFEGASSLLAAVRPLKDEGRYSEARALLEAGDRNSDEAAASAYVNLLAETHEYALAKECVITMISLLPHRDRPSDPYLLFLLNQAERLCVSPAPIDILFDYLKILKDKGDKLKASERAARRRQYFARRWRPRVADVSVVSLGTNCLPWTLANRWGLRDETRFVDEYNPFSQAIHRFNGVVGAISSNFATYVAPDQIMVVNSARGHHIPMRRDRTVIWSHTKGPYWVNAECRRLRAAVEVQIANFRKSCTAEKAVFVLGNYLEDDLELLRPLRDALCSLTGRRETYLIVTNQRAPDQGHALIHADEFTSFFYCPYPARTYAPAKGTSFNSDAGLAFELSYARNIVACMARWKFVGPRPDHHAGVQ